MKTAQITGMVREAGKFAVVFTIFKNDEIFGNLMTPKMYESKLAAQNAGIDAVDYFNLTGKFPNFCG